METQPDPTRGKSRRRRGRCIGLWLVLLMVTGLGGDRGWGPRSVPPARVGAQAPDCAASTVARGQLPPSGGLFATGVLTANYSSPTITGEVSKDLAPELRISRHRLWLDDLTIEASFFPVTDTSTDPQNGCLGRAVLEINIPAEDLFLDGRPVDITSTEPSLTEPSAFYAEGGDPGFTASDVRGTISLTSVAGGRVAATFTLTFNPGSSARLFQNGQLEDDVDQNPAAEGLQR